MDHNYTPAIFYYSQILIHSFDSLIFTLTSSVHVLRVQDNNISETCYQI